MYSLFIRNVIQGPKNILILVTTQVSYYLVFHFKFSSNLYSSQLTDMMCYELPTTSNVDGGLDGLNTRTLANSVLIYNFHNLLTQERLFVFVSNIVTPDKLKMSSYNKLNSVAELFPNANWLEREIAELHGSLFNYKRDVRNLMLQYGDNSKPFQKYFPSVGLYELFYDSLTDLITPSILDLQN